MNEPIPLARSRPLRWWYEMLADYMIAHPQATQNEIAVHFGRTASTISLIVNSDAFKAYFRQRRIEYTEQFDTAVRSKLFKVADASLDHLLASLEKKRDSIPIEMLHRTTDMALKNLGYGATPNGVINIHNSAPSVVNVAVSVEDLQAAREALRRNQLAHPSPPPLVDAGDADAMIDVSPAKSGGADLSSVALGGSGAAPRDEGE